MAMFRYFETNYVWNLAIDLALEMGARIGEIEEMCGGLREAAAARDEEGTRQFAQAWKRTADKLCELAREDEGNGRVLSAGEKYNRASIYYLTAERLLGHGADGREQLYRQGLDAFLRGVEQSGEACQRVEIPYGNSHLAGLFIPAEGKTGPAPLVVQINGLDSMKEMLYRVGLPTLLAKRGVASLLVDQPGTGEALRLQGLTATYRSEEWASKIVDFLETRDDVDHRRIALQGVSLGGYYCPRAVAFEPRFACGAVWGANHDWREVQKRRRAREGNLPVPHYWEHVCWVWGAKDVDQFMAIAESVHLDGILDRIEVPFLVTHGESDSQIPREMAERTFQGLSRSPRRELKIFTEREGGAQHSSFDNAANAGAYIADWLAEALGGHTTPSESKGVSR